MSLINKMLQDLDSRGTPAGEGYATQVRPVMRGAGQARGRAIALAVAGALAVIAAAALSWTYLRPAPHTSAPAVLVPTASLPHGAPSGMTSTIVTTPAGSGAPVAASAASASASAAPVVEPPGRTPFASIPQPASAQQTSAQPAPMQAAERAAAARPAPVAVTVVERERAAPAPKAVRAEAAAPAVVRSTAAVAVAPVTAAPMEPDSPEARAARQAILLTLAARAATPLPYDARAHGSVAAAKDDAAAKGRHAVQGRSEIGSQRAESEYRHALASLQEGRLNETMDALEAALKYDPSHDAARQTLVGLLIEAKRTDDAMRQLQLGLTLDARQPALAMLLARLQIERGGSGIDTLLRTLPYAGNNADYHAFLAAALARQQRHHEAAEQYLLALRGAPANGVWWMGMGISLEADKRNAEALDAFQKAAASANLSQELQLFVARRIQQLGR